MGKWFDRDKIYPKMPIPLERPKGSKVESRPDRKKKIRDFWAKMGIKVTDLREGKGGSWWKND